MSEGDRLVDLVREGINCVLRVGTGTMTTAIFTVQRVMPDRV